MSRKSLLAVPLTLLLGGCASLRPSAAPTAAPPPTSIQMGMSYALIISGFTISATILLVNHYVWLAAVAGLIAAGVSLVLLRLILRLDRYDQKY